MSSPEIQARLEELESRLAFQDDLIESLNEVIARQDRDLALLARQVRHLAAKIEDIGEAAAAVSTEAEIPPHY
jgi:SlyX protein